LLIYIYTLIIAWHRTTLSKIIRGGGYQFQPRFNLNIERNSNLTYFLYCSTAKCSLPLEEPPFPPHHAKTASVTGSLNSSDSLHSDSSLSYPSSSGPRKEAQGSEADSERDSASPHRQRDEVISSSIGVFRKGWCHQFLCPVLTHPYFCPTHICFFPAHFLSCPNQKGLFVHKSRG
jgi:hypothetical protein